MASLGQDLKRERELRGISLKEIADTTRISLRFLQALEENHLDRIPGEFFIRAILRSYAKSIGLDENQVLNKYQEIVIFQEQLQYKEAKKRPRTPHPTRLITRRRMLTISLSVIGGLLALILFYIYAIAPNRNPAPSAKTALQPTSQPAAVQPAPPPEPAVAEIKGLQLEISFLQETWIHAYADGQSIWEGIKGKGGMLTLKAENEVLLNVGNAGGPAITINGKKAKPLGPPGAVRTDIRITLKNYHEYLAPETEDES
jgi:transcriptional regulator with XRE-family HTH domain